jgi:hypothetical protein
MFLVTEADAAAIRAVLDQEGELSAAIEVRRLFPGITDNAKAPRHLGGSYLDRLRFFSNHRRFMRSRRAERNGRSPQELIRGQDHPR